ncbi:MAG: hypothetical protein O7E57_02980, partial [Gammaproteobacteria bacterium]|nr:hypothetical protein [Gammaproteobacteria bacterium]
MNGAADNTARRPGASPDIVQPVGYTPKTASGKGKHLLRLTGWQLTSIILAIPVLAALWFLFAARSVVLEFVPDAQQVTISGGLSFEFGEVYLVTEGVYSVHARAVGYQPLDAPL